MSWKYRTSPLTTDPGWAVGSCSVDPSSLGDSGARAAGRSRNAASAAVETECGIRAR
jgi:hypothetical protein